MRHVMREGRAYLERVLDEIESGRVTTLSRLASAEIFGRLSSFLLDHLLVIVLGHWGVGADDFFFVISHL